MTDQEIEALLIQCKARPSRIMRVCLFASISGMPEARLARLRQDICENLHLDAAGFLALLQETCDSWSASIDRAEAQLASLHWVDAFMEAHADAFSDLLPPDKARGLLVHFLSLSLQQESIASFHNHLKKKDIRQLGELLEDPDALRKASRHLARPVLAAAKGVCAPTSRTFIDHTLAYARLLADYLLALQEQGQGGRTHVGAEMMRCIHRMDEDVLCEFLYQKKPEDSAEKPAPDQTKTRRKA